MILIEGTTALDWLVPLACVMVATDPGRTWKDVALRHVGSCDIVLANRLPLPSGEVPAPKELAAANPLACDLADASDPGTLEYARRLLRLCGVSERPACDSSAARAGR